MSEPGDQTRRQAILEKLGLHRPELRAWAMYDWAITGFWAVVVVTVFPIYFQQVAAAELDRTLATQYFATATTLALVLIAGVAPFIGAIADFVAVKKRMLGFFAGMGVASVAAMFFIHEGDWVLAAILFVIANIGANGSMIFYDALLPHIAKKEEIDKVSTAGFAIGYCGATILLGACLLMIMQPTWLGLPDESTLPTRLSFIAVALWWAGFTIPLMRKVPEPPVAVQASEITAPQAMLRGLRRLVETSRELKLYRHALLMLIAFLIYNDGIGTIIRMATIYGTEIGIDRGVLVGSIMVVQIVGIPCTFLFGAIAYRVGTKPALLGALVVYMAISVLAYFMTSALHFLLLAFLVGAVQGGSQALSRSLFASMIPRHKAGEFFGFFAVFEKFAGIFGPGIFALMIHLTGSSREAILSIIIFFVVGGAILLFVDVDEGRDAARRADEARAAEGST